MRFSKLVLMVTLVCIVVLGSACEVEEESYVNGTYLTETCYVTYEGEDYEFDMADWNKTTNADHRVTFKNADTGERYYFVVESLMCVKD